MTILVTGGAGFIGSHTCVELIGAGYEVVVADDLSNSNIAAIERMQKISGAKFPFYQINVCDNTALEEVFAKHTIDSIIHFAGFKAVGESVRKPIEYYQNNLNSTLNLCACMRKFHVSSIVFSSSATVYTPENPMPLTENSALGCINPYGWTKFMCEKILTDAANAYDWSVALLRYFNPVGAHESGMLGEDPSDVPNNLMPFISQTAIGRLKQLSVYGNDYDTIDGTGVRDYIHVVDLAIGHVAAIKYLSEHKGTQAINLGTGKGTSVLELVNTFKRINSVDVPYVITDRRPGDAPTCYASPDKARELLNWTAKKSVEDMCKDTWNWQTKNPKGYAGE